MRRMKNKKTETFVYNGLGFPVKLINVPMIKVLGKWAMNINLNKLQLAALRALLNKPSPLTGDELRFIRKFLNMSKAEFGEIFGVSHVAVGKWENGKNQKNLNPLELSGNFTTGWSGSSC
jgi:DNA-binding transcriptional regulator YiaG